MKGFLLRSLFGIGAGAILLVILTTSTVVLGDVSTLDGDLYVKYAWGCILCSWFFTIAPLIFEIKRLTLLQQTVIHFILILVFYFTFANWIGWVPYKEGIFYIMILIFVVFYIVFWLAFYTYYARQAKRMNENLDRL